MDTVERYGFLLETCFQCKADGMRRYPGGEWG